MTYHQRISRALTVSLVAALIGPLFVALFIELWFLTVLGFIPLFVTGCLIIANRRRYAGKPGGVAIGPGWVLLSLSGMGLFLGAGLKPPLQAFVVVLGLLAFVLFLGVARYINHFSS